MDEFTDYQNLDLEQMSGAVLDSFCERYLEEAIRVINTGIVLPSDVDMLRMSASIVVGLYFKRISEGIESGDKVAH